MFAEKVTEEQRIERATVQIMRHKNYIFLTNILMLGEAEVLDVDITACTDGRDVLYGRNFVASLTDAELRFLVIHEAFHKMYRHLITWRHLNDKSPQIANQATDYVINLQIVTENPDGFAVMPKCGLLDKRFAGMDAGQVFDILYEEQEESEGGCQGGQGGQGTGETLDVHDWEGAAERSDEEIEELNREIDSALRQGAILAGQQGGNMSDTVGELLKPHIDWRVVLREFARQQCAGRDYSTYAKPNRRFIGQGVYLPTSRSETVPELLVAMDTSGSCWSFLPYFLAELKSVCKTIKALKVHVMFWDTEVVYELHEGRKAEDIVIRDAYGGGGTDVRCVTKYLSDNRIKPTAAIIMTDGIFPTWAEEEWRCPTLWCVVDRHGDHQPSKGKYVHIDPDTVEQ